MAATYHRGAVIKPSSRNSLRSVRYNGAKGSKQGIIYCITALMIMTVFVVGAQLSRSDHRMRTSEHYPWPANKLSPLPHGITDPLIGVQIISHRQHYKSYTRAQFGSAWTDDNDAPEGHNGCDTRDDILRRDGQNMRFGYRSHCPHAVIEAEFIDPYTGTHIHFRRGKNTSKAVQIDHLVPLSYAWDMGARYWDWRTRVRFANDPRELLAVSKKANMSKLDLPPGQWQPSNRGFRCQYNAEFAAVIREYHLNVDTATANALRYYAGICPSV